MTYQFPEDVDGRIKAQMATGHYRCEDDVLREALRALEERHEVQDDIRQGIEDLEAGRGRPLEDVDDELRGKHNIRQDA
jgi:putative addiction module CopG family antidote